MNNNCLELFTVGIDGGDVEVGINVDLKPVVDCMDEFLTEFEQAMLHSIVEGLIIRMSNKINELGLLNNAE